MMNGVMEEAVDTNMRCDVFRLKFPCAQRNLTGRWYTSTSLVSVSCTYFKIKQLEDARQMPILLSGEVRRPRLHLI